MYPTQKVLQLFDCCKFITWFKNLSLFRFFVFFVCLLGYGFFKKITHFQFSIFLFFFACFALVLFVFVSFCMHGSKNKKRIAKTLQRVSQSQDFVCFFFSINFFCFFVTKLKKSKAFQATTHCENFDVLNIFSTSKKTKHITLFFVTRFLLCLLKLIKQQ